MSFSIEDILDTYPAAVQARRRFLQNQALAQAVEQPIAQPAPAPVIAPAPAVAPVPAAPATVPAPAQGAWTVDQDGQQVWAPAPSATLSDYINPWGVKNPQPGFGTAADAQGFFYKKPTSTSDPSTAGYMTYAQAKAEGLGDPITIDTSRGEIGDSSTQVAPNAAMLAKYPRYDLEPGMSDLQGILGVVGAAAGFNTLGGLAGASGIVDPVTGLQAGELGGNAAAANMGSVATAGTAAEGGSIAANAAAASDAAAQAAAAKEAAIQASNANLGYGATGTVDAGLGVDAAANTAAQQAAADTAATTGSTAQSAAEQVMRTIGEGPAKLNLQEMITNASASGDWSQVYETMLSQGMTPTAAADALSGMVAEAGSAAGATAAAKMAAGASTAATVANAAQTAAAAKSLANDGTPKISDIASILGPVAGAALQLSAADKAAAAQQKATDDAIAEVRRQYDTNRADLAPWRTVGGGAVTRLADLMGTSGNTGAAGYGDLTKKFTLADFWDDPVTKASYQQGLDQGVRALDNMAGARGNRNSGAQLKALTRFGTDYTGTQAGGSQARFVADQTNQYNRLAGLSGTGQTAATSGVQAGADKASTIGQMLTSQGNARGAAAIAGGNALGGALSNIGNYYAQQQTLDRILGARAYRG